jgi:hypothetical protein
MVQTLALYSQPSRVLPLKRAVNSLLGKNSRLNWKLLEEGVKGFHGKSRLLNDCAESSAIKLSVIGNNRLGKRRIAPQNHVAAGLALEDKPGLLQDSPAFAAGYPG